MTTFIDERDVIFKDMITNLDNITFQDIKDRIYNLAEVGLTDEKIKEYITRYKILINEELDIAKKDALNRNKNNKSYRSQMQQNKTRRSQGQQKGRRSQSRRSQSQQYKTRRSQSQQIAKSMQ